MSLKNLLSKQDSIYLLEIIQQSLSCRNKIDFFKTMNKLSSLIPYNFSICGLAEIDKKGKIKSYKYINIKYPPEWIKLYLAQKYYRIDPIVQENFTKFTLQYWPETYQKHAPPKKLLSRKEDFGLKKGYTYGLKNPKGKSGSLFSLAGNALDTSNRTKVIITTVIPHLHQALTRIIDQPNRETDNILSARQKEVLNWIKEGKSTWDISVIIGITENTVKFHVNQILQKLDVVNRPHAVAVAIGQGLIDIE